jgi:hypothetical protein
MIPILEFAYLIIVHPTDQPVHRIFMTRAACERTVKQVNYTYQWPYVGCRLPAWRTLKTGEPKVR